MTRFVVLVFVLALGCGGRTADANEDGDASTDSAINDTSVKDTRPADSARDTADVAAPACACVSVASTSYYRQDAMLDSGSYLHFYVSELTLGPAMREGRYTIYAPPNESEPPFVHTVELRDADGNVLATHDYHWGENVSYLRAYTFKFGDYVSISVMCRDGCSMSLWGIPNAFDGKRALVTECCP